MKVRDKLFAAMAAIIMFMAVVFLFISHVYLNSMFQRYAWAARQGEAAQWAAMLSYYYERNHQSWKGVDQYVAEILDQKMSAGHITGLERLVILDRNKHKVFISPSRLASSKALPNQLTPKEILAHGIRVPIIDNGKNVGTLSILDRDLERLYELQERVLTSMTDATVIGVVATAIVALLVGAWLTRLLTQPLQLLISAIYRISAGDLRSQLRLSTQDEFGQVAQAFNDMAEKLHRMEEVRKHLVADVAHELRTPLTIIQGQLELVQQGVRKPDPATLLPIQDEVMRLTRLVDDLHQLSLAEAGVLKFEKREADIVSLVARVVDNFQIEAEDRSIDVSLSATAEQILLPMDPNRITQVLVNLLGNALRYTPEGGQVRIDILETPIAVRISVSDTGHGIAAEHLPHLFDRFYRIEAARSRGSGGMGLGLAIAKEYVEAHGGRIDVTSEASRGSVFVVTLPKSATTEPTSGHGHPARSNAADPA